MNKIVSNFVVDLDGTLIKTDLLYETSLEFIRDNPFKIFTLIFWLLKGKSVLKHKLASVSKLDITLLPYNKNVIELINKKRVEGSFITLASASNKILVDQIASHLGLFDEVVASDYDLNLSGKFKRDILVKKYGSINFEYIGNSRDDLPIWIEASKPIVINSKSIVKALSRSDINSYELVDSDKSNDWLKAIRLHQWAKNILVFVPLFLSHQYINLHLLIAGFQAFILFGFCASSVYVLNDLLDLQDDRKHTYKKFRPFAAGNLSIKSGLLVSILLLFLSFALSILMLPLIFVFWLFIYYILTLVYSVLLKRYVVIDVVTLSILHTLRIIAGAMALNIELIFWLLAFSMFIFLSLAMAKRYAELYELKSTNINEKVHGRGYLASDKQIIASFGTASGYISVLVLALYLNDADTIKYYSNLEIIWFLCPLLLTWISRIWLLSTRGLMNEDPVIFAMHDKFSLYIFAILGILFFIAT